MFILFFETLLTMVPMSSSFYKPELEEEPIQEEATDLAQSEAPSNIGSVLTIKDGVLLSVALMTLRLVR